MFSLTGNFPNDMGSNNLANQEEYIYLTSVSLPVWESMI